MNEAVPFTVKSPCTTKAPLYEPEPAIAKLANVGDAVV
jgi:hypothetical protein